MADGAFVAPDGRRATYGELAGRVDLDVDADPGAPQQASTASSADLARLDLPDKVAGRPRYLADLVLPGQLWGRVVRPPSPAAVLRAVDLDAARLDGVVEVVRDGSFLGVVADREEEAIRATELLRAGARWQEQETLPAAPDWLADLVGRPAEITQVERREEPAARDRVVGEHRASYGRAYLAHASLGPGAAVARWDGDDVAVWTHTQGIFPLRQALGAALDMAPERFTLQHVEGAGCYGHNSADDVALDAVLLARAVPGRPVQVVWSREDEFAWEPFSPAMVAEVAVGVDASGDLVTWEQHAWSNGHDSRPGFFGQPGLLGFWHAADCRHRPPRTRRWPSAAARAATPFRRTASRTSTSRPTASWKRRCAPRRCAG